MALFSIWQDFGFSANPYSQETLTPDPKGDALLVGRDKESGRIQRLIGTDGPFPTIEGPIGVGKSSLLEVSAYRMRVACINQGERELYLPAVRRLQPSGDMAEFEFEVYEVVAQTLIKYAADFGLVGLSEPDVKAIDQWLNAAKYTSWQGGGGVLAVSANAGYGEEGNTGEGYTRSCFPAAIRAILEECFPPRAGGVVLILDNLELVETVADARKTLDHLRDRVFNLPGVRWVLSGSRGIVSRARTDRLSGIFQAPVLLKPLDNESAVQAITQRISNYGGTLAQAPVTPKGFAYLYETLYFNLREALSTAGQFAQWLHEEYIEGDSELPGPDDRDQLLESWLFDRAENAFNDARRVQARHWQFFEELCAAGGRAGASEWADYFSTQQQMGTAVTQLADANLVVREVDPEDGKRKVYVTTPLGWLVYFFRSKFDLPAARVPQGRS